MRTTCDLLCYWLIDIYFLFQLSFSQTCIYKEKKPSQKQKKQPVPQNEDERKIFANQLAFFGVTLRNMLPCWKKETKKGK